MCHLVLFSANFRSLKSARAKLRRYSMDGYVGNTRSAEVEIADVQQTDWSADKNSLSLSLNPRKDECIVITPALLGHFGIARSVRLSVPRRSCLGSRHAGCLQFSHRRQPEMCGLRIRPRTDVDPPRFLPPLFCRRWGVYRLAALGAIACC